MALSNAAAASTILGSPERMAYPHPPPHQMKKWK